MTSTEDWHLCLGFETYAEAIMDSAVYNTIWVETGGHDMRQHAAGQVKA